MRKSVYFAALLVMALATGGSAQQAQPPASDDQEAADRIAALSAGLHADTAETGPEMDALTARIHAAVDAYVQRSFSAPEGSQQIQARLGAILTSHRPNLDYDDLPFARVVDLAAGKSLVVAYTLLRAVHDDLPTIRGYRVNFDRLELAATTGDDFKGYGMHESELRSPIAGEFWLLVWGQAIAANGKIVRFRVYAFDGQTFRTVWAPPEELLNAAVRITNSGFVIDHDVKEPPWAIHDQFLLTADGPLKTTP